jgi:hypothetical protein
MIGPVRSAEPPANEAAPAPATGLSTAEIVAISFGAVAAFVALVTAGAFAFRYWQRRRVPAAGKAMEGPVSAA